MMRKARLAIRKVNVALDSPGYYFGTGRSLIPSSRLFVSGRISSKRERLAPPRLRSYSAGVSHQTAGTMGTSSMGQDNDGNDGRGWKARNRRWGKAPVTYDRNRRH